MKAYVLALLALAPVGCVASSSESSIFDYQVPYDGGGGGNSPSPPENTGGYDADICVVQGSASVSGAVAGASLAAKDAIEIFDATRAKFTFRITDYADACTMGSGVHAGSTVVEIAYDANALHSGTYDLASTDGLTAAFTRYDASCKAASTAPAASGTVTFARLDNCGGEGSFDLVFGSDHVTASFVASVCAIPGGTGACQ